MNTYIHLHNQYINTTKVPQPREKPTLRLSRSWSSRDVLTGTVWYDFGKFPAERELKKSLGQSLLQKI